MVTDEVLGRFSAATRDWFAASFDAPTPAQLGAWQSISSGQHTLVIAPTGSGKTLSAFLWAIDSFQQRPSTGRTRVLYISPLKALGVDIERNLQAPLVGIDHAARTLGRQSASPRVGVRSGDTTAQERRALVSSPPDILITTPESLYLLLTSAASSMLTDVETVIVDEVHAVAGTKRGAHLAVSLERLDALLERPARRIGLSATVEPRAEVARFLGGAQPVHVVAPPSSKTWQLEVVVPVPDMANLPAVEGASDSGPDASTGIWGFIEADVLDLVLANRSTIVFVNARRAAERLTSRLNELYAERMGEPVERSVPQPSAVIGSLGNDIAFGATTELARTHHGSVSKEQRAQIEDDLKSGRLRCVVATSSLELGIDMGDVDLVVQVEAPPSVAAGLQRVGRAGHQVGAASRGTFFPKHRADVLHTAIVTKRMLTGELEPLAIPANPLDILAQQTVAACALTTLDVEEWFDIVRRSAPFGTLPRSAFDATLDLLAGKYPSTEFAELRPRIVWDRDRGTIIGRPGAQRLAVTSGGTIPDRGLFGVFIVGDGNGRRVGELDEEMVYESRVGDVFALGATSWRIEEITHDRVLVSPAFGQSGRLPFWVGDTLGRPIELGRALGALQRGIADGTTSGDDLGAIGMDANAVANAASYVREQAEATGVVPSDVDLVLERFVDELGDWRVVLHCPLGRAVNAPWALAVASRVRERYGVEGAAMAADDGIVVRIPMVDDEPPGADLFTFEPEELNAIVTEEVGSSALFAARFRECAARALLLPRRNPGKRAPLWQQRLRASQLLEVARNYPSFPIILETLRECLSDVYDLPALREVAGQLRSRRLRMVEVTTTTASPFARTLLFGYVAQFMYEGDAPLAERRAAALSIDSALLADLLGHTDLRELLDDEVIAAVEAQLQRLTDDRKASGTEGLADLLRVLGPLTLDGVRARLTDPEAADEHAQSLISSGRAYWHRDQLVAVEDAGLQLYGLGAPVPPGVPSVFLQQVPDPLGELLGRYARTRGPFTTDEAAADLRAARAVVDEVCQRLAASRKLTAGSFRAGTVGPEWCDVEVLRRIRQRTLAALRAGIEPVPAAAYGRFLPTWQQVGSRLRGADGVAAVLEQLAGATAPASAWESFILPARVVDYSPALLDEVLASGEFVFAGAGSLGSADGWLGFHVAADAHLTLDRLIDVEVTPAQQAVLDQLTGGGRFLRDLEASPADLWALVWAGYVTNDTFAPVRALLAGGTTTHRQRNPARFRTARVGRVRPSAVNLSVPGGRWALLPTPESDPTLVAHARTEYLLDRNGVVTRGAVSGDDIRGGFGAAYRVLARMEERGLCRRGYFIEHLGGAQFAPTGTIDLLRASATPGEREADVLTLAATDPANPYGAALPWPAGEGHRPGRKAGALVVLVNGALGLYVERGGKTALSFTDDHLGEIASSLVAALRRGRVPKLAIETLNGSSIIGTPLAEALLAAGFYASPRSVRFRS